MFFLCTFDHRLPHHNTQSCQLRILRVLLCSFCLHSVYWVLRACLSTLLMQHVIIWIRIFLRRPVSTKKHYDFRFTSCFFFRRVGENCSSYRSCFIYVNKENNATIRQIFYTIKPRKRAVRIIQPSAFSYQKAFLVF